MIYKRLLRDIYFRHIGEEKEGRSTPRNGSYRLHGHVNCPRLEKGLLQPFRSLNQRMEWTAHAKKWTIERILE